ncbi:hypothetical protein [Spirosoma sp. KNUC1025]|uniref:hypothetical protein n=1 Tax=Spirosoma sp. KNUC1025 TaxID=2894082 RepID=UPI00386B3DE4|nr:hypothetical protein LN737_10280 [Spirosoma sp. KNUC1025]
MRFFLTVLALLIASRISAQLSVGSNGMTILAGTSVSIDGLTLTPTANVTVANNSIQKINSPGAGSPNGSIGRAYRFGSPLAFSGTLRLQYLTTELNGGNESGLQLAYSSAENGPFTIVTGSTVDASNNLVSNSISNKSLFVVTAAVLPDLSPILYARPSIQYGPTSFGLVVDVFELNSVATSGSFTVRINKDPKVPFSFQPNATSVAGRSVQNSAWSFDASDEDYYILTTSQSVAAGNVLSFGLTGVLNPGATSGVLSFNSLVLPGTLVESNLTNNIDADKVDYFQQ